LRDLACRPERNRRASAMVLVRSVAGGSAQHELVSFDEADRCGVGAQQLACIRRHRLDDTRRIELGGEVAADSRELLRQPAGAALALEQPATFERALGGVREMPRERDVVVGEGALVGEEDERDAVGAERDREQRAEALGRKRAPAIAEPRIGARLGRGDDEAAGAAVGEPGRQRRDRLDGVFGELVAPREPHRVPVGHQHCGETAAE
jgi:hypothetical protein